MATEQVSKGAHPAGGSVPLKDIFGVYLKIGTIGFGGGFAVLDLIYEEMVTRRGWLTDQRYQNAVSLSEMAPGALTVNLMAGIAYRLGGWPAMVIGTLALVLPSFLLILGLAGAFLAWQHHPVVIGALEGLTAGVVGLLIAVVWDLIRKAPKHWCCLVVGLATLLIGFVYPINPIWLVLMGGLAGSGRALSEAMRQKKGSAGDGRQRGA